MTASPSRSPWPKCPPSVICKAIFLSQMMLGSLGKALFLNRLRYFNIVGNDTLESFTLPVTSIGGYSAYVILSYGA